MENSKNGFALIFMAIILVMVGALIFQMKEVAPSTNSRAATETNLRLKKIRYAVKAYKDELGNTNYPCPARLDLATTNASFGAEIADCTTNLTTAGMGAVPTKTLGLPYYYAFDGWGHYFLYMKKADNSAAIHSTNIAGTAGYGAVSPTLMSFLESGVDMATLKVAIISHGPDGLGAYTKSGTRITCSSSNTDKENCDDDWTLIYDRWSTGYDDLMTGLE